MSIHIPQISVDRNGDLIPNPGEDVISVYKPVEHDSHEGELYVTNSRMAWIGTKSKGSFLGKIAKAAIIVGAMGAGAYMGSRGGRRMGMGPTMGGGIGGFGGGMGGLGMTHMVSRNQQGQSQTVSLPYEVINDVQLGGDQQSLTLATRAGSVMFRFRSQGDAGAAAASIGTQRTSSQGRLSSYQQSNNYQRTPPPQYVPPPPPSQGFHYCPHCGTPIEPNSEYCHNCGERLR